MKYSTAFTTILASASIVSASPMPVVAENADTSFAKTIVPMQWTGKAFLDGPDVTLNGTIQEVHAQLVALNPNFDEVMSHNLARLSTRKAQGIYCQSQVCGYDAGAQGDGWANGVRIQQGIDYLRGFPGAIRLATGNAVCSRISCSYNAAIFLCNDDPNHELNLALNFAGEMANDVLQSPNCRSAPNLGGSVRGHCFRGPFHDGNSDAYNVWIREVKC